MKREREMKSGGVKEQSKMRERDDDDELRERGNKRDQNRRMMR